MHSTASPDQMLRKKRSATPGLGSGHSETETGKGSRQMNKQCLSDSQDNTKRSEVETPDVTEVRGWKEMEKLFEEIMAENFPSLRKTVTHNSMKANKPHTV